MKEEEEEDSPSTLSSCPYWLHLTQTQRPQMWGKDFYKPWHHPLSFDKVRNLSRFYHLPLEDPSWAKKEAWSHCASTEIHTNLKQTNMSDQVRSYTTTFIPEKRFHLTESCWIWTRLKEGLHASLLALIKMRIIRII